MGHRLNIVSLRDGKNRMLSASVLMERTTEIPSALLAEERIPDVHGPGATYQIQQSRAGAVAVVPGISCCV